MRHLAWDEEAEFEGWFWLLGADERFYGRLTHQPDEGSGLHFFDVPGPDIRSREPALPIDSRLLGELAGGRPLTLDGFFPANWSQTGFNNPTTTIDGFAESVLLDCHLDADEPLLADSFGAALYGLEPTLNGAHGEPGLLNPHGGRKIGNLAEGESRQVQLPDGAILLVHSGEQGSLSPGVSHTEVRAELNITVASVGRADQLEQRYLEPLREFIIFSTRRTSYVRSLRFGAQANQAEVTVLRQPWPYPRRPLKNQYRLGLNLGRVSDPDGVLRRWFSLRDEVGAVWRLLFATLARNDGLLENRFLDFMAFMEGYHRALRDKLPLSKNEAKAARKVMLGALADQHEKARELFEKRLAHANSQDQYDRVLDLAQQAKDLLGEHWDFDPETQCRAMVDTRNWMTHWGSRTKRVADDAPSLVHFCRNLELIAYVAILRDLDLDSDESFIAVAHGWVLDNLIN